MDEELSRLKAWQDGVANAVLGSDADIPSNGDNATVSAAEVVAEARRTVQERVNALEGRITAMHEELMSSKLAGQREVQEPGGGILAGRIASAEESAQAALRAVDGLREEMAGVANASRYGCLSSRC